MRGLVTVLANGVFDILHVGHVQHLIEAAAMGDRLVVSLTLDSMVNKGPGRPLYPWQDRAQVLRALKCVDFVFPTRSAIDAIRSIRPRIFVKGTDYSGRDKWTEEIEAVCKEVGAELRFTHSPKQSVTEVIRRTMAIEETGTWATPSK